MSEFVLTGRSERTYRLSLAFNAMCDIEDATELTFRRALKALRSRKVDRALATRILRPMFVDAVDEVTTRRIVRDIGGMAVIRAALRGVV